MYADDLTIRSHSEAGAQALLNVRHVFCQLFGMEVNFAVHKTQDT
jgi:hypothetical protein